MLMLLLLDIIVYLVAYHNSSMYFLFHTTSLINPLCSIFNTLIIFFLRRKEIGTCRGIEYFQTFQECLYWPVFRGLSG